MCAFSPSFTNVNSWGCPAVGLRPLGRRRPVRRRQSARGSFCPSRLSAVPSLPPAPPVVRLSVDIARGSRDLPRPRPLSPNFYSHLRLWFVILRLWGCLPLWRSASRSAVRAVVRARPTGGTPPARSASLLSPR